MIFDERYIMIYLSTHLQIFSVAATHPVILGAQKALYAGAGHLCLGCSVLQLGIIFHDFFRRWKISILVCTDKHISAYVYVHIYICIICIYICLYNTGKDRF